MLQIVVYLVFIVSVAMAAGSIILSSKLREKYHNDLFSILLYLEVFIFTFGFYGIWGQLVIKAFLSQYISPELLSRFTDIALLLGLPFLVFAWLMLIRLSCGISGRTCNSWIVLWFLALNFGLLILAGYLIAVTDSFQPALILKIYFISMNIIYGFSCFFLILYRGRNNPLVHHYDRRIIAAALLTAMILQCAPLVLYNGEKFTGILFILIFFTGNAFLPVYFSYGIKLSAEEPTELPKDLSFEDFCKKYEVSPRESDIIREICKGLSNKEISEKLFISLQTVKDHTHRIYIKTNVKSRVQLMNLVKNESEGA
ncbi:MAG: response regulator transcription factor [Methanosarcina sp.]